MLLATCTFGVKKLGLRSRLRSVLSRHTTHTLYLPGRKWIRDFAPSYFPSNWTRTTMATCSNQQRKTRPPCDTTRCTGFVPALMFGGPDTLDHLEKVKAVETSHPALPNRRTPALQFFRSVDDRSRQRTKVVLNGQSFFQIFREIRWGNRIGGKCRFRASIATKANYPISYWNIGQSMVGPVTATGFSGSSILRNMKEWWHPGFEETKLKEKDNYHLIARGAFGNLYLWGEENRIFP